ncbi:AraC-type DNA-binding protein [Chitinophaga rupis]|uniref:AraC-type DNA-binding protein n=1 Tax=Chitinophaga rupis TaxID=573321 RepID=A0A1H7PJA6_9BACT|nr:AraC family transcriptional regulator [Chitinophaga rupis]SEL35852.1 AraC-type DNA-binding protein [Chitinophaga rupis]
MKKENNPVTILNSISELHRSLGLPGPEHPLVSIVCFSDLSNDAVYSTGLIFNFYMVAIKKDFNGKLRYGQQYYDFDEGVMTFIAPGQLCYEEEPTDRPRSGYMILFHPDFIRNYALGKNIKSFEFFNYAINEALYLSQKEETIIEGIFGNIQQEYRLNIDKFSQDVIVSHIELLLTYCNRFYNRQFITRKSAGSSLLEKMEQLLQEHFNNANGQGLPTVKSLAAQLNVSPGYLSDMLRQLTGQSTQQHIHSKLIEKAKEMLSTSNSTIAEVAYQLGFEHPQSFNKLFKQKTKVSPVEFRQSFN